MSTFAEAAESPIAEIKASIKNTKSFNRRASAGNLLGSSKANFLQLPTATYGLADSQHSSSIGSVNEEIDSVAPITSMVK